MTSCIIVKITSQPLVFGLFCDHLFCLSFITTLHIYLFYYATQLRFSFYVYHLFSELVFTVWLFLFNDISVLVCFASLLDYDFLFSVCFDLFVCFKNCWQCTILSTTKKEKKRNRLALELFFWIFLKICLEISDWNVLWQFHYVIALKFPSFLNICGGVPWMLNLYGAHRMCAKMAAVSHGTNNITTK